MLSFFFFNDTAPTEIYTLSLHDALPISRRGGAHHGACPGQRIGRVTGRRDAHELRECDRLAGRNIERDFSPALSQVSESRSEEHTSELQSQSNLVCRLLLEKKITH